MRRTRRLVASLAGLLAVLSAVAAPANAGSQSSSSDPRLASPQGCFLGPSAGPASSAVAWSQMRNPILTYPSLSLKDEAMRYYRGRWHALFTAITPDPVHLGIASATSANLTEWSAPARWPDQAGTLGVASPDLVQTADGSFVATYTSIPGQTGGGQPKLYYRTSRNLTTWSAPRRLAPQLFDSPRDRLIDPALATSGRGLILGFKLGASSGQQHFEIAYSPTGSLEGPWRLVGRPDITLYGDTVENYQFLQVRGRWRLLATSNQLDQPWLFSLAGPAGRPASWLRWTGGYQLQVPNEAWDLGQGVTGAGYEHANSAYLCDATALDGHYYLFFSGSDELTSYGGLGYNSIGVARSTDLVHWEVPPG